MVRLSTSHRSPVVLRPVLVLALVVAIGALVVPSVRTTAAGDRHLILVQQFDDTSRTFYIADHIDHIETLPFDGMTVHIPASWFVMSGRPLNYRNVCDDWLAPIDGIFQRFDQNFPMAFNDDPGDVFDDAAWAVTVENWRILVRADRAAGFVGICFDYLSEPTTP